MNDKVNQIIIQEDQFLEQLRAKTLFVENPISVDYDKRIIRIGNCEINSFNIDYYFDLRSINHSFKYFSKVDKDLINKLNALNQRKDTILSKINKSSFKIYNYFLKIIDEECNSLIESSIGEIVKNNESIKLSKTSGPLKDKPSNKNHTYSLLSVNQLRKDLTIGRISKFTKNEIHLFVDKSKVLEAKELIKEHEDCVLLLRKANNELNQLLNRRHDLVVRRLLHTIWVKTIDEDVFKAITFACSMKTKSMFLIKNKRFIEEYHSIKPLYQEVKEDGNIHIAPYVALFQKNTEQLSEFFGKGLWKKICHQSLSRNKNIAFLINHYFLDNKYNVDDTIRHNNFSCKNNLKELVSLLVTFKSYHLNNLIYFSIYDGFSLDSFMDISKHLSHDSIKSGSKLPINKNDLDLNNSYKEKQNFGIVRLFESKNIYQDTQNMARNLGLTFNPKWSPSKMKKKHDEYVLIQISKNVIHKEYEDWNNIFNDIELNILKEDKYKNLKITRISSTTELAIEGKNMKHCVYTYSDRVNNGKYLVFHIDYNGIKSTLGLSIRKAFDLTSTVFNQHYSFCNTKVNNKLILEFQNDLIMELKTKQSGKLKFSKAA